MKPSEEDNANSMTIYSQRQRCRRDPARFSP
jgi:hypothetical protein